MTAPVRLEWIPSGDWGARVTLARMAELARAGTGLPLTRRVASTILGASQAPRDRWGRAGLLRAYLAEHFRFRHDPVGPGVFGTLEDIEHLQSPEVQLATIARAYTVEGDCDDAAILGASLAVSSVMGLPARFRVISFDAAGPYTHVYTEVLTERGWMDLDVTRRNPNPPPVRRTETFAV